MRDKVWCCGVRDGSLTVSCSGDSHVLSRSYHYQCVQAEYDEAGDEWICQDCSNFGDRPSSSHTDNTWDSQRNAQLPEETQTQIPASDGLEPDDDDQADSEQDERDHATGILHERYHPTERYHQYLISYDAFVDNTGEQQPAKERWRRAAHWQGTSEEKAFLDAQGVQIHLSPEEKQASIKAAMVPLDFDIYDPAAEECRNSYWPCLRTGYFAVVERLWQDISTHRLTHSALKGVSEGLFKDVSGEILACTPDRILRAICGRGLYRCKLEDTSLRSLLDHYRAMSVGRPCIYVLEFVDHKGRSLTVEEMRRFIKLARRYAHPDGSNEDYILAIKVDEATGLLSPAEKVMRASGTRRCLGTPESEEEMDRLLNTLESLVDRTVTKMNLADNDHLPFSLSDAGYTDNGTRRLEKDHENQKSSNKLMNLFQSLSSVYFGAMYTMRGDVVYLCHRQASASFGEILFTMLSQSYTDTGRGFNGHPAGQNLGNLLRSYDSVSRWATWASEALNQGPFYDNMTAEEARIDRFKQQMTEKRTQIAAAKLAIKQEEVRQLRENVVLRETIASVEDSIARLHVNEDQ